MKLSKLAYDSFKLSVCLIFLMLLATACSQEKSAGLFKKLDQKQTGLDFRNLIIEKETFNIFKYQYFYNGGGVAAGDFNNDGLTDLVFTGNMVKNRIYLNKGKLQFEDITSKAGISEKEGWCTGVSVADVNCDGWLDIYVCRAGYPFDHLTSNLLYINNHDLTFTEKAKEYGLDDNSHSTQSAFFDYDRDGDLDMLLINHSEVEFSRGLLEVVQIRSQKKPAKATKLFRNDGARFTDVTAAAGITSNVLSFSLGLNIADINGDGWSDVLIGNDFNEPDYLFINNQNGTFSDQMAAHFDHTAMFTMGGDVADINNDGLHDIIQLDMLPEGNYAQKMHSGADNFDKSANLIRNGFYYQYSRNMLQINNGDGTFSEIGQLAGISNTDWSWSPLFFDFDNDGWKDLFVSNGYLRDHTDMDFLKFTEEEVQRINKGEKNIAFSEYMKKMPPINQPNYFFRNKGNLQFEDMTKVWGLDIPSVSQGAIYADFDNDGDLDIATNMSDDYAGFFENLSQSAGKNASTSNNFLKVKLVGDACNREGIGSKVYVYGGGNRYFQEVQPVHGFQASALEGLTFGVGKATLLDSVVINWNTGESQVFKSVAANTTLKAEKTGAGKLQASPQNVAFKPMFSPVSLPENLAKHQERHTLDFHTQYLLPWYYSKEGPALAVADVNGDNHPDVYLGGASGQSGQLLLSKSATGWSSIQAPFHADVESEDQDAIFFDADGDNDLDLYVCSGSYELTQGTPALKDRLYINQGNGKYIKQPVAQLPAVNTSCVRAADVDMDGDMDLFVGGYVVPQQFPKSEPSYLLLNDGKGNFTASVVQPQGLVKDATWINLDTDTALELVVAAEYAPLQAFKYSNGGLQPMQGVFPAHTNGMWQSIKAMDVNQDGTQDIVAGNIGLNNQLFASATQPLELIFDDFDKNGSTDPILCRYYENELYPFISREDMISQLRSMAKKFNYFKDYAGAKVKDVFTAEQLAKAQRWQVHTLQSMVFVQEKGSFSAQPLPIEAQIAPVCAIEQVEADGDGLQDLVLAGNVSSARVKLGKLDGNHGLLLRNTGKGSFTPVTYASSGFKVRGDVRALRHFNHSGKDWLFFGVNDGAMQIYQGQKRAVQ